MSLKERNKDKHNDVQTKNFIFKSFLTLLACFLIQNF